MRGTGAIAMMDMMKDEDRQTGLVLPIPIVVQFQAVRLGSLKTLNMRALRSSVPDTLGAGERVVLGDQGVSDALSRRVPSRRATASLVSIGEPSVTRLRGPVECEGRTGHILAGRSSRLRS